MTCGLFLYSSFHATFYPGYNSHKHASCAQTTRSLRAATPTVKMVMHQFDYIFATGTIFAFLDAWNIGTPSLPPTHVRTVMIL